MTGKQKNIKYDLWRVLEWMFFLLMGVQILLGMVWLVKNIGCQPWFYETQSYLKAANELRIDEHMGILYPILIFVAEKTEQIMGIPYYSFLYVVQLCVALYALVHFLNQQGWITKNGKRSIIKKYWLAAYLLTFPLLLQLHLAVLPYSLAASVLLLLVSEGLRGLKNEAVFSGRDLIRLCGLWILGYLLLPDYSWLAGIFVCSVFIKRMYMDRKWSMQMVIALLSTVLCFGVIAGSTQTPGSMGRIQKTVGSAMVHRFVWPYFVRDSFFWEEEIHDTFSYQDLVKMSQAPELVDTQFGPILEEKYGRKEANRMYWEMALTSFASGSKQTLKNISRDFLANLCPQAGFQVSLADNENTLNGWNYARLTDQSPVAAKYYLKVSMAGWNFMCLWGVLQWIFQTAARIRQKKTNQSGKIWSVVLISLLGMTVWYTMSRGMQDYKYVMMNSFFWLMPVIRGYLCIIKKRKNCEK